MRSLLLLLVLLLSACSAPQVQKRPTTVHGVVIETLQSAVNVSLSSPSGRLSGNGVLFYRRPESFRLTILAPFGQRIFDIVAIGETVLLLDEKGKRGWRGGMQEIPERLGLKIWPLIKWVVEPPHPAGPSLARTFTRPDGTFDMVYYDDAGFVIRKVNSAGDEVRYSDYTVSGGVVVPGRMELSTSGGSAVTLILDEPEVGGPLDNEIFSPAVDGYRILPLADFRGF